MPHRPTPTTAPPVITVARGRTVPPAAQVLEHVRAAGVVHRDEVAARSGLSSATVARAVAQLLDAGVLRERPDQARAGAVGRPGTPVEVDPDRFTTVGLHVGRRLATVALGDLRGHVVAHRVLRRQPGDAPDLALLGRTAAELLGGLPGRAPLAAGLVGPWRELGIDPDRAGEELHDLLGLDVRTAEHVAAVAAAEFLHRRHGTPGTTLYVYARDTVGFVVALEKDGATEVSRVGSLTHFPTGSGVRCRCGRTGCLEVTAGDEALVSRARELGLVGGPDVEQLYAAVAEPEVRRLLTDRARVLGQVAADVRDVVAPDRVVLVGQAFTGCPQVLDEVIAAMERTTALGPGPVSVTRFGAGIQATAACTVALGPVYDDPLAAVPRPPAVLPPTA